MTDKPYIVRFRLHSSAPSGQAGTLWNEIVNRKDIRDNPAKYELIQEFSTKSEAVIFTKTTLAKIAIGWLLYKLQSTSDAWNK